MIQEKDFLYRVPVKTAPITTPRGQIRNPEILVDLEGGEFMHGNILDANSTNKLINQSVKDAVDDKFNESGHVTKDLLDAETSARTKGDEALGAKIKAEQTRAEGKEKEISDKLAIVDGDSNTEGSFRKAIADVIAAAPEDLDTLKEIADKLAGNDDLHTALNQAITEKADASALANEVTRATGAESGLQAAIAAKADRSDLMALEQKITANTTALEGKQNKGNYVVFSSQDEYTYNFDKKFILTDQSFVASDDEGREATMSEYGLFINNGGKQVTYTYAGIMDESHPDCIPTTNRLFKPISDFVLKEDADEEYVRPEDFENLEQAFSGLSRKVSNKQDTITANIVDITNLETADITQLRAIVKDLLNALSSSGLIIESQGVE